MNDANYYRAPGMPEDVREDHIVRATALKGHVRALAIRSTKAVGKAFEIHGTSPVATAALGRFISGSLLVADNMKGEEDTQTSIIKCDGPIKGMTCVCDSKGHARAYIIEPVVESEHYAPGKLNVAASIGNGTLTVVRDIGLKEPYVGSVELMSGEIAEDFTYYMAKSEQTPSVIALGVLMDQTGVTQAGGLMIQMLPGATEEDISYIEERANGGFPDITFLLSEGLSPAQIIDMFIGDPEICFLSSNEISYQCNCSDERMQEVIASLSKKDRAELAGDPNGIEIKCHFCGKKYHFTSEEIAKISEEC